MIEYSFKYRIYGRSKGRKRKNVNFDDYQKRLKSFSLNNLNEKLNNILDIGSGNGENTIYLAEKFKDAEIISCDKYYDGNTNLLNYIEKKQWNNVYIHNGNVNELLDRYEIKNYFNAVWILFPDPWPKKKHHKRRLLNSMFFEKILRYMKESAYIYIVTDSKSYLKHILFEIYKLKDKIIWINQRKHEWEFVNNSIPETKFYKKALKYGRKPFFIKLKKL